jgi:NIMA (never in mitosis gene a)-related kinase
MENYVVVKLVGKGSFGTAEVVEDRRDKSRYILKKTRLARQPELQREASIQEMFLQKVVNHRNIVHCREQWMDKAFVANLVLEYCSKGELSDMLQSRLKHQYLEEDTILEMFVQVSLYLGSSRMLFRDERITNQPIYCRSSEPACDSVAVHA